MVVDYVSHKLKQLATINSLICEQSAFVLLKN
ncbi:hypothetical protein EXY25_08040 [Corallincola spongiicola]|uniref:Uncharacterized protein n=1 Tax=Corallincola spongiicola TaxID=2520508 RepID=A0ABY1WR38_9GAMM|nr:hypothetical protein EXY25_08040 [Corallincola spongiicola]